MYAIVLYVNILRHEIFLGKISERGDEQFMLI